MGHKAGVIACDGTVVFTHAKAAGEVIDYPDAADRAVPVNEGRRAEGLTDESFIAVLPFGHKGLLIVFENMDIGAFAREKGLDNKIAHGRGGVNVMKPRGQEVGVFWVAFPQEGQDAFVGENHFPGWFEEGGVALGQIGGERVAHHMFPWV